MKRMQTNLLMALLCLTGACIIATSALAEKVSYIEHGWNEEKKELTTTIPNPSMECTVLTGTVEEETTLSGGWYVARGTLTYTERLTVSGSVHLILEDECSVVAQKGITVQSSDTLTIYAQSDGKDMGVLKASAARASVNRGDAGIGGLDSNAGGTIVIHGGKVTGRGDRGGGAGIGGGWKKNGTVTIYGGEVTGEGGGSSGACIGGGYKGDGTVTINGGNVTASAVDDGAGIGGGSYGVCEVIITGGRVTATTSARAKAIGYGYSGGGSGGSVEITGGHVIALNTGGRPYAIGGEDCAISLGWSNNDDYIYADYYEGNVTLTTEFKDAKTGERIEEAIKGKMLVPPESNLINYWTGADLILPDDLTAVDANAFAGIAAKAVLVPAKVTSIGAAAFANSGLSTIRFLGENTSIDESAFSGCSILFAFAPDESQTLTRLKDFSNVVPVPMD